MSGIDWAGADVVAGCQLATATALAVHLLILRPWGARRDLLLDVRIVQDELDLAERLGKVATARPETVALQQLLRRIRQNPRSAGLVLERIPALVRAAEDSTRPVDGEYLGGALDRLSDAGQRYLRGAWPRAGALIRTISTAPSATRQSVGDDTDQHRAPSGDPAAARHPGHLGEDLDQLADQPDDELDQEAACGSDGDARSERFAAVSDDPDDPALALDLDSDPDLNSDPDGNHPAWATEERARHAVREPIGPTPLGPAPASAGLANVDSVPAWVDLVQAETPRRNSGVGQAERHARPYRPARSAGHSSSRRIEQPDRSSVLPR